MDEHTLLADLILVYAVALGAIVALARVHVPPIVALIVAGAVAGPSAFGIVRTQREVDLLSEIGIVLLLFTVGLEFSLGEIRRVWRTVLAGGLVQIVGTAAAVGVGVWALLGFRTPDAVLIGAFVALSSTAIVLRKLGESNELDSPHGRLMVGVLLLQDMGVVLLLLLVPLLAGNTPASAVPLVALRAVAAMALVLVVSRVMLPVIMRWVTASRRREAFPLAVLLASVGTAWLSSLLGVSMALGAFLGGLVLAESEYSHQAHAEVRPLRDLLAGLFFISLGMLVDPRVIFGPRGLVVALSAVIIVVVKALVATGGFVATGTPARVAISSGIGLAQVGEFSFILGRAGLAAGLLSADTWQVLLASSIATMALTPALVAVGPRVAARLAGVLPGGSAELPPVEQSDHVVILGFGVGGQLMARALSEIAVRYLVIELNGASVHAARREGQPIIYGDATTTDTLQGAGVGQAKAVVVLLSDPDAARRAVQAARSISATVPVIVRTRYRREADQLIRQGATFAVAEELEASLEVLAQLFSRLDVPGNVTEQFLDRVRQESTGTRPLRAARTTLDSLPSGIRDAPIASHQIGEHDWAVGRTLAEIDLKARTGALVVAVRQDTGYVPSPSASLLLESGAVLYLMGDDANVVSARRLLTGGSAGG